MAVFLIPLFVWLGVIGATHESAPLAARLALMGFGFGMGCAFFGTVFGLGIARNLSFVPERISIDEDGFTYVYPGGKTRKYHWTKEWIQLLVIPAGAEAGTTAEKITLRPPNGGRAGWHCPPAGLTSQAAEAVLTTANRVGLRVVPKVLEKSWANPYPPGTVWYSIGR